MVQARQDTDEEFQDCHEEITDSHIQSGMAPIPIGDEVIQVASNDQEEVKVFDSGDASQMTLPGVVVPLNSFSDPKVEADETVPPPRYLSQEYILRPLPVNKAEYLQGLEVDEQGCLVCTDEEALNKQKGVLSNVAKQLAINLLKGLSISHISLPIKIFEDRSSIQRVVDLWSSAPKFLSLAARATDPVERLKFVIAFGMTSILLCAGQNKPFNPLLGETNQGSFADGSRYYCEHTSHHPPITHYLLEGPNGSYRMFGYYEFIGKMGKNSLTSGLRGPCTIEFADYSRIRFNAPDFRLGGTLMGARTIEATNSIVFEDLANQLRAVVTLGTFKEAGFFSKKTSGNKSDFVGIVYKIKQGSVAPTKFGKGQDLPADITKLKDVQSKICDITGNWLNQLVIGGQQYWNVATHQVTRQIPQTDQDQVGLLMPSDWRFREDLIWLKYGFMTIAASWKLRLEVQQRKDRKNRQDTEKARSRR